MPGRDRPHDDSTSSDLSGSAGDVVQARDVHGGVHFHTPTAPPAGTPRQLPADVRGFVNRHHELGIIDALWASDPDELPRTGVYVLAGTAGVGKTALAIHLAHRVAPRFPDGQLCLNMRGYDPGAPLTAADALDRFLRALDVTPTAIPTDVEDRAALYRSRLAERRVLILLDNVATVRQVRPLLPGTAHCLVIVTSRSRLSAPAVRDGAQRITLDVLPETDAVTLLDNLTNAYRPHEDREQITELARLCARLPLALRVAAERAASRPLMPIDLIRDLRDEYALWDALSAEDDDESDAVRTVFAWSYRALPEPAAQLFRLLGLHPGPQFSAPAAAALIGDTLGTARHLLDVLAGAHLIDQIAPDRFQFHDLLRAFAIDQGRDDAGPGRIAALRRVITWYAHTANAAESRIGILDLAIPLPAQAPRTPPPDFDAERSAALWMDTENDNLLASIRAAAREPELQELAWRLAALTRRYYMRHNLFDAWFASAHIGLDAARAIHDQHGLAEMHDSLGMAYVATQQLDNAIRHHTAALDIRRDLGDQLSEAVSLNALGLTKLRARHLTNAANHFAQSAALFDQLGDASWQAFAQLNLAGTLVELGELTQAVELLEQARAQFRAENSAEGEGNALRLLSRISLRENTFSDALRYARAAVDIAVEAENRMWEGFWLLDLGAAQLATGNTADALISYQRSASIQRRLGDRVREALALNGTGHIYQRLDRVDEAINFHRGAVLILRTVTAAWNLATALNDLAAALVKTGRRSDAESHWQEALALVDDLADPATDQLRESISRSLAMLAPE
ncbi:ATP-binding protein [Cryptosporangium arvum]|uniref:NB-ARC domain protein n=1 Tax=Cryptosporangium arvum DSM 44712 TaxID=927661 RepID=A0A010Z3P1_9ACTN|nr:tetratricopeptide repeat protein [Cryptosporangium arvum]EXG82013.1 NB-ARC domain protein [Cryptosporangium arvum DSM 44712]